MQLSSLLLVAVSTVSGNGSDLSSTVSANLTARCIGPANISGRITDLAVYEKNPQNLYIASASGGVWKTTNGGLTAIPVFDNERVGSIGAVAVSQRDPEDVWVGTGEATARNSVGWGNGIYRSHDGGKTWKWVGLPFSRHIARIVLDPIHAETAFAAACGPLWGQGGDRGVFKTVDGGHHWRRTLFVDQKTAAADIAIDPIDGRTLLAAMWQVVRKPYDFQSGGPGSGLFRSIDGGETWKRVTSGLPPSPYGRIGLSFMRKNPKVVVATIQYAAATSEKRETMVEDGGLFRSTDGGKSWKFLNRFNPRPFYFSRPLADPIDSAKIYVPGWRLFVSQDTGKTFHALGNDKGGYLDREPKWMPYHDDVHVVWADPRQSDHLIFGTDGGVYQSFDGGKTLDHFENLPIAQFYSVAFDNRDPYWVYGGTQDSYTWAIPTFNERGYSVGADAYRFTHGDGFHVAVDPSDWRTLYAETQLGQIVRVDQATGDSESIRPEPLGETGKFRFNWNTPFALSPFDSHVLYVGTNKLLKSVDRGNHWSEISPDLSTNDPAKLQPGKQSVTEDFPLTETHCTIVTLAESPLNKGEIWAGTDDGQLQLTRDGGSTWLNVTPNIHGLPANTWCAKVSPSHHKSGRVYVVFDGHREADFHPFVYVTENFGQTWTSLAYGLPQDGSLYVLREDVQNPDLLFLGSESGLRFSLDRGQNWQDIQSGLPPVEVFDLKVQPRERELIVGTHGRGIWLMDIWNLEQLTKEVRTQDVALLAPKEVRLRGWKGASDFNGDRGWRSLNAPVGTDIGFWLGSATKVSILLTDPKSKRTRQMDVDGHAGFNTVRWDGRMADRSRTAGTHTLTLRTKSVKRQSTVNVILPVNN